MQPFHLPARKRIFPAVLAVTLTMGCSSMADFPAAADNSSEIVYEYNGIRKNKSELSDDTVRWLEWYQSLPDEQQDALSFVPSEFTSERASVAETTSSAALTESTSVVSETRSYEYADTYESIGASEDVIESQNKSVPGYLESLSDNDRYETEELVRYYFSESFEETGEIEAIEPAPDDFPWYQNKGIEAEYTPGNIIIYQVLTTDDRLLGYGWRSVSIARRSKSDEWKVINSGY